MAIGFSVAIGVSGPFSVSAAEAGAWETFSTQGNANAWVVYDYSDSMEYYPSWNGGVAGEEDIYFTHTGENPLWFYTGVDEQAGAGVLVGDYDVERIQGVRVNIEIDRLADFESVDCAVYATGNEGLRYYYSPSFTAADFSEAGWWTLEFLFNSTWYYYDEATTSYIETEVTPGLLQSVEEIGFRFFPKLGVTTDSFAALDNIQLIPTLSGLETAVSHTSNQFLFAFTPGNGVSCAIQKMGDSPNFPWVDVNGQTGIVGPAEHVFSAPLSGVKGFYRVLSSESFTPFITVE